jgi:hypothetical protein
MLSNINTYLVSTLRGQNFIETMLSSPVIYWPAINVEYRSSSLLNNEFHNLYRSSDLSEILSLGIYDRLGLYVRYGLQIILKKF